MKKILAFLLVFLYCISFTACSPNTNNNDDGNHTSTEEPAEIRTTITMDEFRAALNAGNYSILSNYMLPYISHGNSLSTGGAEITKLTNDCASIDFFSKSGQPVDSVFYKKIDGVLYYIEKIGEEYVATKMDFDDEELDNYSQTESLACWFLSAFNLDWSAVYNSLVYVEDCKTYRGIFWPIRDNLIVAAQIEMECENGNIKKLRVYLTDRDRNEPLNGLFTFYDFGTTVVELPEYIFENE